MPARGVATILRRMNADIFIFFALQLAAVLGVGVFVVTVLALGSPGVETDV